MKKIIAVTSSLVLTLALSGTVSAANYPQKFDRFIEKGNYQNGEMRIFLDGAESDLRPKVDGEDAFYPYIKRNDNGGYTTGYIHGTFVDDNFFILNDDLKNFPLFNGGVFYKKWLNVNTYETDTVIYFNEDLQLNLGSLGHSTQLIKKGVEEKYFSLGYGGDTSPGMAIKWGLFPLRNGLAAAGINVAYTKADNTIYVGNIPEIAKKEEKNANKAELVIYKGKDSDQLQDFKFTYDGDPGPGNKGAGSFKGYQTNDDIQLDLIQSDMVPWDATFIKSSELSDSGNTKTFSFRDGKTFTYSKDKRFSFNEAFKQNTDQYLNLSDRLIVWLDTPKKK